MITGVVTMPSEEYRRIVAECQECKTSAFECTHCPDCGKHATWQFPKGTWFMSSGHCAECSAKRDVILAERQNQRRIEWITETKALIERDGLDKVLSDIYDNQGSYW